ncbi:hypothetical protein [Nocardia niigatensis]|uniref:hypothetical protein n=1 Tax=Nocardia niigatensis TaxID=209249 RepID=UPI0002ED5194|nr:hypothetical protein [Nocardia niigatensis]
MPVAHSWLHMDGRPIEVDRWQTEMTVAKFHAETVRQVQHDLNGGVEPIWEDFARHGVQPDDWAHEVGNLMTTAGLNLLTQLFEGAGGNAFNHTDAIVGVGSSSTAALVGDTALGGNGSTTTAYYQQADTSYPTQSNGLITCYCTFGSGNANFAWNEWCLGDGSGGITAGGTLASVATGVVMINHKIASLGTKTSGASWTAQCTITES